jgi:hypothetical protein
VPALRRNLIAGTFAGLCGALVFAIAHAIVIVPIWNRTAFGFLSGALAGAVAGWAYTELGFEAHVTSGARFGALLWLAVVPVTLADALLRVLGIAPRYELVAVGIAVILAVSAGAALGWRRTHRRRAAVAGAMATLLLTLAMAGPVPIGRSPRALAIFLAVFPAAAVGGAILGGLSNTLGRLGTLVRPRDGAFPPGRSERRRVRSP